mmetsp:Transcript_4369/g.11310  ORF Transcript_4369/g.11310 Transcript_4369/m.11310 type:complete len:457 (+) Transcript_4369:421-1791(+)
MGILGLPRGAHATGSPASAIVRPGDRRRTAGTRARGQDTGDAKHGRRMGLTGRGEGGTPPRGMRTRPGRDTRTASRETAKCASFCSAFTGRNRQHLQAHARFRLAVQSITGGKPKPRSLEIRERGRALRLPLRPSGRKRGMRVSALDAAQNFDFESKAGRRRSTSVDKENGEPAKRLKIGLVGFGTFGQFLAKKIVERGHTVIATSRSSYQGEAEEMGVEFFSSVDDFCEEHPDVVVLCTSILSVEKVLSSFPFLRLRRNTLMVDVLSVKEFPKNLLLRRVPPEFDVLCTHPMFGPDSGKVSWDSLPFMYDEVRIGSTKGSKQRCKAFLKIFEGEGCRMIPMTCEEHDRQAASTQFITHTVGRMLGEMSPTSTEINTKGYESLLSLVEQTCNDSFELYYGLFMYNQNATETLDAMEKAFDRTKKKLFDQLHDILRSQLFETEPGTTSRDQHSEEAE